MDWVTSQVSQNTPFSLTITLPILSEQWYNLAYILFLYTVKLTNMDYSSCSVWLDMCCLTFWSALLARKSVRPDFETIFRPVKIGLRRTSPPSPPLCAALCDIMPAFNELHANLYAAHRWSTGFDWCTLNAPVGLAGCTIMFKQQWLAVGPAQCMEWGTVYIEWNGTRPLGWHFKTQVFRPREMWD